MWGRKLWALRRAFMAELGVGAAAGLNEGRSC